MFGDVGDGDPFAEDDIADESSAELMPAMADLQDSHQVAVQAHDNSLQLRLQGTGAIAESGQVREL